MIIISQNIKNFDFPLPKDIVFRINLAWVNSLDELKQILINNINEKIFLDIPIGRLKPPNNRYSLDELTPIINEFNNIKYIAISNVEKAHDLIIFKEKISEKIILVPKIESPTAILNIQEIVKELNHDEKILMLDHDDLYSSILKQNGKSDDFHQHISKLVEFCDLNKILLLRTVGVVFSDSEKRISQYVK